jgi:DNA-binding MarR family transcriptional regulator
LTLRVDAEPGAMTSSGREALIETTLGRIRKVFFRTITDYGNSISRTQLPMLPHMALHATLHGGGTTQRELAEFLGVSTGYVTGLVDQLEEAGFAVRKRDPDDRRLVHVTATAHGRLIHDRIHSESQKGFATVFDDWTDADIRTFQEFLSRLETASSGHHKGHPKHRPPRAAHATER